MLSLLHPAALWTLAALALPLAIHLRRPPPRTVRLGSLRSLESIPRRPWRHPRWRELLLLYARLGLLAVLALWLAGPRWTAPPAAGPRRWALLDPTANLDGESRARWQALRANGYETHLLAPGFPAVSGVPSPAADAPAPDLWSLLREADAELPAGSALAVFSPGRLAALRGVRPALAHCRVEWQPIPDPDAVLIHNWVINEQFARPLEGHSDARATTFTPRPAGPSAMVAATSVLILYDAPNAADARYVEASVRAAADSCGRPVHLQTRAITPDAENSAATDWTFWLSNAPIPAGLANRAPRTVRYAGGDAVVAADGVIVAPGDGAADGVRLHKRTLPTASASSAATFWTDGRGNPLLSYSHPPGARETWELFTRFDPDWNDLPRTAALPSWVRALVFAGSAAVDPAHDRRLADPSQGPPADSLAAAVPALQPVDQPTFDPHWIFCVLAGLLFTLERTLSLRRPAPSARPANPRPAVAAVR